MATVGVKGVKNLKRSGVMETNLQLCLMTSQSVQLFA